MRVAVDVGGTFTDVAFWDGTALHTAKVSTTPDQSDGVIAVVAVMGARGVDLVHGTTAATNAVLQRTGARTAFVTDAGFEDVIEIGRQDRPSLYDNAVTRPAPLVPAGLRFGIPGRSTAADAGPTSDLDDVIAAVAACRPEAVAVSMLYAFAHPERERIVCVGRYVVEPTTEFAEVAFMVRDDYQRRGIGTRLVKDLVRVARANGVKGFEADVLGDNVAGMKVFHKLGYTVEEDRKEGACRVRVTF